MRVLLVLLILLLINVQAFPTSESRIRTTPILAPDQTSPCPPPGPADISNQQIPFSTSNETLPGHVVLPVRQGKALFSTYLPTNLQLPLELVFKIRNPDQFQQCLDAINDPSSPYYEKFLNATTLEPFLPTPGQKTSVTTLLQQNGFTVTPGASPLVLNLNGNVKVIQSAFGLQLALYAYAGASFFASNTDPELPINISGLVNGVIGLDNYTKPKPAESPCSGPYCPQGIQVGYTFSSLISAGHDGSGQTVAVVDEPGDPAPQTAITQYSTQYGLPAITLSLPTPDGMPTSYDPGWASEAAMDIEAVHSVAPRAGIALVYIPSAFDIMDGIDYVASHHIANVISNSWTYDCAGGATCPDTSLGSAFITSEDSRLVADVAQGVTIVFASGDSGSNPGHTLGTEFPSSDPNVLAVGATNLVLAGSCNPSCTGYVSESGATISGGGYSGAFSEPSWQTSAIGPTPTGYLGHGRAVPDVSMLGGINPGPGIWVYSTLSDRCGTGRGSIANQWFGCSGTSLSTPLWAGYLAIVIQVRGGLQLGNVNPKLYQLASGTGYSILFHDITLGSNGAYSAVPGWDPVTGWGSPQANNLALALAPILTTTVASGSGSLSPSCPTGCLEAAGTPISISASPTTGWVFSSWTITGASCSGGTGSTPCAFTMPYNPVTASAIFIQITSISLTVNPQTITFGSSVLLSGSITPNPGSVQVTISASPDNLSWTPIIFVNTNSGGAYSTSWTPPYPSNYGLQASWGGNSGLQGSTSSPPRGLKVTGTRPQSPTLQLTAPTSVAVGQSARLSLTFFNPTTNPLSTQIAIEVLGPNNYVSFDTINVQVAASSQTTILYDWTAPNEAGTYTIITQTLPTQPSAFDSATITVM